MFNNSFPQVLLLLISSISAFAYADDSASGAETVIDGSKLEHTSIYQGTCVHATNKDLDVTDSCSSLVAVMYLADGRVLINLEHGDHQVTTLYLTPVTASSAVQQLLRLTRITTDSGSAAVEGKCQLSPHKSVRNLACSANGNDGRWEFEFADLVRLSPEKK